MAGSQIFSSRSRSAGSRRRSSARLAPASAAFAKRLPPRLDQRADGLPDDQPDQIVRRVVAARQFAREHAGPYRKTAVRPACELVFEQPFVDGAELLHAQVTEVDVIAVARTVEKAEPVDNPGDILVAKPDALSSSGVRPASNRPPL